MQMKLIALAVAGLVAAPAFAQSNVQIYGSLDALFETFTNDNTGTMMDDATHKTSRLGFVGSEDLGGGMKAFFQLEERFHLDTSTADGNLRFKDKAWVGLSGGFGSVSFGRVPTALDIIYGGSKIANVDTIADWSSRKATTDGRVDNGISYTSPKFGPVTVYAHTALKEKSGAPTPYGLSFNATFGPAFVEAGYQKDSLGDTTPSDLECEFDAVAQSVTCETEDLDVGGNLNKSIIVNGGYKFGFGSVYAAYARSKGYTHDGMGDSDRKQTRYAVGADFGVSSAGKLFVTLGRGKSTNNNGVEAPNYTKLGVAYVHSLSKRTQLIAATSFEKQDNQFAGEDQRIGIQGGLRHAF